MPMPSCEQVNDGCYIDFEGFGPNEHGGSPPPALIGIYNRDGGGKFEQVVFTRAYRWAAEDPGEGYEHEVRYDNGREAYLKKLVKSIRKNKPLFAFSEYEMNVINRILGYNITQRYKNVRKIAACWLDNQGDGFPSPESNKFEDLSAAIGVSLDYTFEKGGLTDRLREVRVYSNTARNWKAAPEAVREKWREVLRYNRSDVMGIHAMMKKMISG